MTKMIVLPTTPTQITIDPDWVARRDELIKTSKGIVTVTDDDGFTASGAVIKHLTRQANEMEFIRKKLGHPFLAAQKIIKRMGDEARQPLIDEAKRIKRLASDFYEQQQAASRKERAEIEAAQRAEAERQLAEHEKAVKIGMEEAGSMPEIVLPDVPEPEATKPHSYDLSVRKDIVFRITDADAVPYHLCSPDDQKIRAWIKEHKADILRVNQDADGDVAFIPGVAITVATKVQSR